MATWWEVFSRNGSTPENLTAEQIVVRCAIIYAVGVIAVRVGKSRILGRASPLDVILAFILGSLLSRGINGSATLWGTAIAVTTLVAFHSVLTALACRYHWLGDMVKGKTHVLIRDGQILSENLLRSHISERDLMEELRLNANVEDPGKVQAAYKERSGQVGVVCREPSLQVIDIAVRDGVQTVRIELAAK